MSSSDDELAGEGDEVELALAGADFDDPGSRDRELGVGCDDVAGSGWGGIDDERADTSIWEDPRVIVCLRTVRAPPEHRIDGASDRQYSHKETDP